MIKVTIHQAKTHLSRLIQQALSGEEVVIAKGKTPLVRIEPLREALGERRLGGAPGLVVSMADDFNAPVDDMSEHSR